MQEMLAAFAAGPPKWHRPLVFCLTGLLALAFALIVMEQWAVWIMLGLAIGGIWGLIPATVLSVAQMLMLFEQGNGEACTPKAPRKRAWWSRKGP